MNSKNHGVNKFCFDFCLFCLKSLSWNLHFSVYFCYWRNSFMKRDGLFLVKLQTKNLCFCLKGCPNKHYNVVFKHFCQNIRAYPRSKKDLGWPMIGKMSHIGKNLSKARCWQKSLVCPKCSLGILGELQCRENFAILFLF